MNPRIGLVALGAVGSLVLAGCGSADSSSGGGMSVGYISPVGSQPGQQQIKTGLEAGAKALDWDVNVLDANLSTDKQISHVDTMISQKKKVISSWSLDDNAMAGVYARAKSEGIPVVGVNSEGESMDTTVWWEVNTCEPGGPFERQAKWIAERKPGAKVVVFGGPPVKSITNNVKCFTAAAEAAGLVVLGKTDNVKDTAASASTLAADELTKHPDVDVFWAYNDSSALGISSALNSAKKTVYTTDNKKGVMVLGINGDAEAITAIRDGRITSTWDPNTLATGYAVIKAMKATVDGAADADKPLIVKSDMYTKENIDSYVKPSARKYTLDTLPLVTG